MPYETRVLRTEEEINAHADAWNGLRQQQPRRHIEQHPEWLSVEAMREVVSGAMAVALFQDGELVGVAPLVLRRWDFKWRAGRRSPVRFPMRLADFCGEELIAPDDPAAQETLLRAILDACASCHVIRFEYLPVGSCLWRLLREAPFVGQKHWVYDPWGVTPRRMVHLPATFEEYVAKFQSSTRHKLEQEVRKLNRAFEGQLCLHRVTERAQLPAFLKEAERLSALSWQGTRLGKVLRAESAEAERLGALADRGWLRGYLLCGGEKPLVFLIGRQADGIYHADQTGYDPQWAKYAPGKVLLYLLMKDLYAANTPEWLDFRRGERGQKQFFANYSYDETSAYLIRKAVYTGLAVGFPAALQGARTATRALFDRLGLLGKFRRLRARPRRAVREQGE